MSVDTRLAKVYNMKIEDERQRGLGETLGERALFQIDSSPQKKHHIMNHHAAALHEDMILERPEDDSMLLKASGFSLNTTNLVNNPLIADDDLESVLSLQPEKLDLKNLN